MSPRKKNSASSPKKGDEKCIVPPAMPVEALSSYVLETGDKKEDIRSYVEWQAPDETVKHLEKVKTESIYGQKMDAWDVQTDMNRWWVITNPTNLYSQENFPSLDYTLSFHVGLTTRMNQAKMCKEQESAHDDVTQLFNRLARVSDTLFAAQNQEDFQSVGMKCRECLLNIVQSFGKEYVALDEQGTPQSGNFIAWSEFITDRIASGASNERLRSYLKTISKSTWQFVNWLTHAQNAGKYDGSIAVDATENVLMSYIFARSKYEASKKESN